MFPIANNSFKKLFTLKDTYGPKVLFWIMPLECPGLDPPLYLGFYDAVFETSFGKERLLLMQVEC